MGYGTFSWANYGAGCHCQNMNLKTGAFSSLEAQRISIDYRDSVVAPALKSLKEVRGDLK